MKCWNEDEIERLLDRALTDYSRQLPGEAPPHLEQRILANLAAHQRCSPFRWWIWIATPAGAALAIAIALWFWGAWSLHPYSQIAFVPPKAIAPAVTELHRGIPERNPAVRHQRANSQATHPRQMPTVAQSEPRLATFPSAPDEQQARMLLSFVRNHQQVAIHAVKDEQQFQEFAANSWNTEPLD